MSFILDALKKSEAERQRQNSPGIASIPKSSAPRSSAKWIWVVAVLVVVNVGVLAAVLFSRDPIVTDTEIVSTPVEPRREEATFSELVSEVKRSQAEIEALPEQPLSASSGVNEAAFESGSKPEAEANEITPAGTVNDGFPSFNDLRASGELQLPELHLDMHVYAGAREDRFVFVNMKKYKERATLSEGPQIREITPEGVVMEHGSIVFLLPRQ